MSPTSNDRMSNTIFAVGRHSVITWLYFSELNVLDGISYILGQAACCKYLRDPFSGKVCSCNGKLGIPRG